jgi:hypothetical protein
LVDHILGTHRRKDYSEESNYRNRKNTSIGILLHNRESLLLSSLQTESIEWSESIHFDQFQNYTDQDMDNLLRNYLPVMPMLNKIHCKYKNTCLPYRLDEHGSQVVVVLEVVVGVGVVVG